MKGMSGVRFALVFVIAAIATLGVAIGAWFGSGSGRRDAEASSPPTGCGASYDDPSVAGGQGALAWASTQEATKVFDDLHESIERESSILDLRVHYAERTIIIVNAPDASPPQSVTDSIVARASSIGAAVEFVRGCSSRDELEVVATDVRETMGRVVTDEDLRRLGGVAVSIDLALGRVRLEAAREVGERILDAMTSKRDLVDFVESPADLATRSVDPMPFSGGATFTTYDTGTLVGNCTSGFGARFTGYGGFDVMTTAAHCGMGGSLPMGAYNAGSQIGLFYDDGNFASYVYPGPPSTYGHDVAMLYNPGATYSNQIYADPGPSPRFVTNYGDAFAGTPVCTNGYVTLSSCYSLPADFNATLCAWISSWNATKCMWVVRFTLYGGQMVIPGDSGGTVYQIWGSNTARVSGVITGRNTLTSSIFVTPVSFFTADAVIPKT